MQISTRWRRPGRAAAADQRVAPRLLTVKINRQIGKLIGGRQVGEGDPGEAGATIDIEDDARCSSRAPTAAARAGAGVG